MGALLRKASGILIRLILAPAVFVLIGACATLGWVLGRKEEEPVAPDPVEVQEREEEDENERGERRWSQDLSHAAYRNVIMNVHGHNEMHCRRFLRPHHWELVRLGR